MPRSLPSTVEQLLKCLRQHQFDQLGQFVEAVPALRPAAQLRLEQQGLPHNASAIGFVVRQFCEQAIRALAATDPRSDPLAHDCGQLLDLFYLQRRDRDAIEADIGLSSSTYDRRRKLAPQLFAMSLERICSQFSQPLRTVERRSFPAPPEEWVGRDSMLAELDDQWSEGHIRVIGLIGFGGEGKSSLARQWVHHLLSSPGATLRRDHVFWWAFHEPYSVEIFFEEALKFLSNGQIDPKKYPSASQRVKLIVDALMRRPQRVIFVLDGFEAMQIQDGDQYGSIRNHDLRELLERMADNDHRSLCLLTSRIPLFELIRFPSYYQMEVDRLSAEEGRALLRKLGVNGTDRALDQIVSQWDGHALALTLLGKYVAEIHGGDVSRGGVTPPLPPIVGETRYERAERVLRWYDETLPNTHRVFLKIFSVFRAPVPDRALENVFRLDTNDPDAMTAPLARLDAPAFGMVIRQLLDYRILRQEPAHLTAHPLIRTHYHSLLDQSDRAPVQKLHSIIKDYYLTMAGAVSPNPTLEELNPVIEAIHHACCAGEYKAAFQLCDERIYQGIEDRRVIARELGAYETIVAIMSEFFPAGDWLQDPLIEDDKSKGWMLNEIGLALMLVGRTGEVMPFLERSRAIYTAMKDWSEICVSYRNAMDLNFILGNLAACHDDAAQSLAFARKANDQKEILKSLVNHAWILSLRGETEPAEALFADAENVQRAIDPSMPYLHGLLGIRQVEHLLWTGQTRYAREVAEHNLRVCEEEQWIPYQSQCHCHFGDLDAHEGQFDSARDHYDIAIKLATTVSHRFAYLEAIMSRGFFRARYMRDKASALRDLIEVLEYAIRGNYRMYESYIRCGLAWAHLAAADREAARLEAIRSRQISEAIGYFWGKRDADEVLGALKK